MGSRRGWWSSDRWPRSLAFPPQCDQALWSVFMSATNIPLGSDVFTPAARGRVIESRIMAGGQVIVGVLDATGEVHYFDEKRVRLAS